MYQIFTDSGANLTPKLVSELDIHIIPLRCLIDGTVDSTAFTLPDGSFDGKTFYDRMRAGADVKTTMINVGNFCDAFGAALEAGDDVIYVSLSSGISGTYQAAVMAAEELSAKYPERRIHPVDTWGAGLGEGLCVLAAAEKRQAGASFEEAAAAAEDARLHLCQYFTVDDLRYLQKGGRISALTAKIGGILNIKPILWGSNDGEIVLAGKTRGSRRALEELAQRYSACCTDYSARIAITDADNPEATAWLLNRLRELGFTGEAITACYEPITGAHVGPGAIALFFRGAARRNEA